MKTTFIYLILFSIGLFALVACYKRPPEEPLALSATIAVQRPTPLPESTLPIEITATIVATASSTATPSASITLTPSPLATQPIAHTATPTATPLPTSTPPPWWRGYLIGLKDVLPSGAEPLYDQMWESTGLRSCINTTSPVVSSPYRLPSGEWGIAIIIGRSLDGSSDPALYWDWQQEELGPASWQEIRYFPAPSDPVFTFVGLDNEGQWWIAVLYGPCGSLALQALLPISQPDQIGMYLSYEEDEGVMKYWVQDGAALTAYEWQNNIATPVWVLPVPDGYSFVQPRQQDLTGDGRLEWTVTWQGHEHGLMQIYQVEAGPLHLIGQVETSYHQYIDVDGDGLNEFLWATPPEAPTEWQVYGWNGVQFDWQSPLVRETAVVSTVLDVNNLPPIPTDFYFQVNGAWRQWSPSDKAFKSSSQPLVTAPPISCPPVDLNGIGSIEFWSPDCLFALLEVRPYIEGSANAVLQRESGVQWDVPNTFVYISGYSTFAWDMSTPSLIHARADGSGGLYRLNLNTGTNETLLSLSGNFERSFYGAVDPTVLPDGSIIFTIQGINPSLYPPHGVYRLWPSGELRLLADIPPLFPPENQDGYVQYGSLQVSPDGSMYVYHVPYASVPYAVVLLGTTDGNALWDLLNSQLPNSPNTQDGVGEDVRD